MLDFGGRGHGNFRGFNGLLNTRARDLGPSHSLLLTAGSHVMTECFVALLYEHVL